MARITKLNKYSTRAFVILFEIGLLCRLISLYSLLDSRVDTMFFSLSAVLGLLALGSGLLLCLQQRKLPNIWLGLFILAMFIATLFNGRQFLVANVKLIIWQVLFCFVIYYALQEKDPWLLRWFERILFTFFTVAMVISLLMFFTRFAYTAPLKKIYYGLRLGFVQNRLYGVFTDPNFSANLAVVTSALVLRHLFVDKLQRRTRVGYIVMLVMNFIYLVLSGSRTGQIECAVLVFAVVFMLVLKDGIGTPTLTRWLQAVGIGIVAVAIFGGATWGVKRALPLATVRVEYKFVNQAITNAEDKKSDVSLNREDVSDNTDMSNGRLALWKSAVMIFKSRPLYGTSPRAMVPYAQKHLPETRIAQTRQTPHNFWLYVLAATGILGFLPLLIFMVREIVIILRGLFAHGDMNVDFLMFSIIAATGFIFGCLAPDLIFENKIGALCFWMFLGAAGRQAREIMVQQRKDRIFWKH